MIFKMQKKLNNVVENDEPLARYIFEKGHFSKENKRIKRHAFMPPKGKATVSVIRRKDCPQDCVLKIGKKMEKGRDNNLKAVGSILTEDVRSINGLDVESDTRKGQHRRHANITKFNNYTKAKIRSLAQDLASKATLLYVIE